MMPGHCAPSATMSRTEQDLQPAWLLHRRPFRNTSLIADLFVPDLGRVAAVVRGGRKDPSLSPFRPLLVELKASGDMYSLRGCEPRAPTLKLEGKALYCGFYVNELLSRLLHRDDPHPDLWPLYEETLAALTEGALLDVVLRQFEMGLLEEMGYGIDLGHDIHGEPVRPDRHYQMDPAQGVLAAPRGYSGADLLALLNGDWSPSARRTARQLCRALLAPHLGDKPLKSRELFRER